MSISKSRTALPCPCLLPCVCTGFRFPSPPVQNSLEASCQRLNKVFIWDTNAPCMTSESSCGFPRCIRYSLGVAERMESLSLFRCSHWSYFCQAVAHALKMEAGPWCQPGLLTACQDYPDENNCSHLTQPFPLGWYGLGATEELSIETNKSGSIYLVMYGFLKVWPTLISSIHMDLILF